MGSRTREMLSALDDIEPLHTDPRRSTSPRLAALDLWEAQSAAIQSHFRVPDLKKAADSIQCATNEVADRIAARRPTTALEAALKFKILRIRYADGSGGFDQPEMIHDFQSDLDHLAGITIDS